MASELAVRIRKWEQQGWRLNRLNGGNFRATYLLNTNVSPVIVSANPSDPHAFSNTEALMRKNLAAAGVTTEPVVERQTVKKQKFTEKEHISYVTVEDKPLYLAAWMVSYMYLRISGKSFVTIRAAKYRYRTDQKFVDLIINSFRSLSAVQISRLEKTMLSGVQKPSSFRASLSVVAIEEVVTGRTEEGIHASSEQQALELSIKDLMNKYSLLKAENNTLREQLSTTTTQLETVQADIKRYQIALERQGSRARITIHNLRESVNKAFGVCVDEFNLTASLSNITPKPLPEKIATPVPDKSTGPKIIYDPPLDEVEQTFLNASAPVVIIPPPIHPVDVKKPKGKAAKPAAVQPLEQPSAELEAAVDTVGKRVSKSRSSLGLSQVKFAKLLGITGSAVSLIETDKMPLSSRLLPLFAKHLGVSENYIMHGTTPKKAKK